MVDLTSASANPLVILYENSSLFQVFPPIDTPFDILQMLFDLDFWSSDITIILLRTVTAARLPQCYTIIVSFDPHITFMR